ncbi:hypothetical protein TRFO_35921 [Tritrichomonas foetus]|uniref:Uncharacterized protein n=1 Tax=Tritrichomonas foetus TaxID=1144522 RepID=A0A1J4JKI9_9EUKA|nr:hypothetical protein TRFO_35921 [Tritrichomonas foetus]|eukprot:OHS97756.1 hypothetical protein TRFO_35921 [Tritrichomonas foetus]
MLVKKNSINCIKPTIIRVLHKLVMTFTLPSTIPNNLEILEGCIRDEMRNLENIQKEITEFQSKEKTKPFLFRKPDPSLKLPGKMKLSLLNTLLYKGPIPKYYVFKQDVDKYLVYISTPHEIHLFNIPVSRNYPVIKVPKPNLEIENFLFVQASSIILVQFTNNEIYTYSLSVNSWNAPFNYKFENHINNMNFVNNMIYFQHGDNSFSLIDKLTLELKETIELPTQKVIHSYFPESSIDFFFITNDQNLLIFSVLTLSVIQKVPINNVNVNKLFVPPQAPFVVLYGKDETALMGRNYLINKQLEFGSDQMILHNDLLFYIALSEDDFGEQVKSLFIGSIETKQTLSILTINHINIISFDVIRCMNERKLVIYGSDYSISFWSLICLFPEPGPNQMIPPNIGNYASMNKNMQHVYQMHQNGMPQAILMPNSQIQMNTKNVVIVDANMQNMQNMQKVYQPILLSPSQSVMKPKVNRTEIANQPQNLHQSNENNSENASNEENPEN